MRITHEKGKKYRAYSPQEFFKSPESPQPFYGLNELKPKRSDAKELNDQTARKSN